VSGRTPEERERARWEREVLRARREGRPEPPPPASIADPAAGLFADIGRTEPEPENPEPEEHAAPAEPWADAGDPAPEPRPPSSLPLDDAGPPTEAWPAPEPAEQPTEAWPAPTEDELTAEHEAEATAEHELEPDLDHEIPSGTRRGMPARLHMPQRPARPVPPPRAPKAPGRRRGVTVGRIAAVIAILLVAFLAWFLISLFQPFHGSGKGNIDVNVPDGASARQVGDLLERKGVISSSFFFSLRATLSGDRSKLGSGTYHLQRDMSYAAALTALTHPPAPPKTITITLPEGPSIRELAPKVKGAGLTGSYAAAARQRPPKAYRPTGARTLEGFLFPATYQLKPGASAKDLVAEQLATFQRRFREINLRYARRHKLTAYDVVTIASMVEREAATQHDRPLVAAVIYNRLHAGMTLGIDATLRYRLNYWSGQLRQSQLANPTAYNTRIHKGLPPTPIGNPGMAALQAAAHPAKVSYLYYVAQPCSPNQAFSTSSKKFLADQQRYQRALAKYHGAPPTKC
jgi:peptidoglycan lytic transglycosylase G